MLVCSNLGFGRTSLSPLWVQVQPVLMAMAWAHLCVDRQPGSGPGWGCSWSLPGRAPNPVASTPFGLFFFFTWLKGMQEFYPSESHS